MRSSVLGTDGCTNGEATNTVRLVGIMGSRIRNDLGEKLRVVHFEAAVNQRFELLSLGYKREQRKDHHPQSFSFVFFFPQTNFSSLYSFSLRQMEAVLSHPASKIPLLLVNLYCSHISCTAPNPSPKKDERNRYEADARTRDIINNWASWYTPVRRVSAVHVP